MMRSLYSGVSGLKTHQTKMDVIGNNIANVNTIAFKSSSTTFTDIMYQTTSGASRATENTGGRNANQIGLGVTSGSTKVSITAAGAAQSTGQAFDIKLTDSNNTNFFIVNNGSENLFSRSGSFYIDGNGNLCMSSTGYMVMGWQVDPTTQAIKKDTVSALRVMNAANLTSPPEATENANVKGVIDKNDTNVTSDSGYAMSLSFYDNLGYQYTAKFAVRSVDSDNGTYSVELANIYDDDNNDILKAWMDADPVNNTLNKVFGTDTTATKAFSLQTGFTFNTTGNIIETVYEGQTYQRNGDIVTEGGVKGCWFKDTASAATHFFSLAEIYGVDDETISKTGSTLAISATTGELEMTYPTTNHTLQFNKADGSFSFIGSAGNKSQNLDMTQFGVQFKTIDVNFQNSLNYDNGGTSTMAIDKGDISGTQGVGKKLGTMTGLSVDGTGKIYGSYDNGNTVLLGQIAVAQFANASGLEATGNSCYRTTLNSGDFDGIGVEVTADGGSMNTGQLEMSNVDLSAEFTEMITTQRGFQANSRVITTSDTMLEELVNLKR
ncbi:MAG: flagellar hook-basal body complex protein [Lachnospiraceae bacterium]|nr:flagellar hook-basal body complex protein [Lachnospiraceae bacterium]